MTSIFNNENWLEAIKQELGCETDRELADLVGAQLQTVSLWRRKKRSPSLIFRRAIQEQLKKKQNGD